MTTEGKSQFRVVLDDVPAVVVEKLGPAAADLTFTLTFWAESLEDAERIARGATADVFGKWHVEAVE